MTARRTAMLLAVSAMTVWTAGRARAEAERFKDLPPGWKVLQDVEVPQDQAARFAAALGGRLSKVSNTLLEAEGRPLQVNVAECPSEADAEKVHEAFLRAHAGSRDHALRIGKTVVEFTKCPDPRLVKRAAYVLGFRPKTATYRISFDAAPIEGGDYMSWNALFNAFVAWREKPEDPEALRRIAALRAKFTFGRRISLRTLGLGAERSRYTLQPKAEKQLPACRGDVVEYAFARLSEKAGMPCVTITATVTSTAFATTPTDRKPGPELLGPTPFWPSEDAEVVALARKITADAETAETKVQALLDWLMPGKNIKFAGPVTGSRYGVKQVLKQRFGHCWDFSDLMIALCRATGVPARQVAGWLHEECGHIWAEVLLPEKGWLQVEPTAGMACTSRHIPYLTSETGAMPIVYLSMPTITVLRTK